MNRFDEKIGWGMVLFVVLAILLIGGMYIHNYEEPVHVEETETPATEGTPVDPFTAGDCGGDCWDSGDDVPLLKAA